MSVVRISAVASWSAQFDAQEQHRLLELLEDGQVLLFPNLAFALVGEEQRLRTPLVSDGRSKNISFDPQTGRITGCALGDAQIEVLRVIMARFTRACTGFAQQMLPQYAEELCPQLASYRPLEIEGRDTSDRKNDTRLHVDAFASRPSQGQRILRVFCNVNMIGKSRAPG